MTFAASSWDVYAAAGDNSLLEAVKEQIYHFSFYLFIFGCFVVFCFETGFCYEV